MLGKFEIGDKVRHIENEKIGTIKLKEMYDSLLPYFVEWQRPGVGATWERESSLEQLRENSLMQQQSSRGPAV